MQKKLGLTLAGLVTLLFSCSSPVSNAGNGNTTPASWNVRFITNDASTVFQTVQVDPPDYKLSIAPNPPAKDGYLFDGWFTEPDGTGTKVIARMPISANLDVYEHWSSYLYTVTFDSRGAEVASDPATLTAGSPTCMLGTLPGNPKKAGYNFGGWFTAPDGQGTEITAKTVFAENATVYARWDSYSYTITYDSGEATTPAAPATAVVASPAVSVGSLPSAPEKTGYAFGGWFTGPSGTGTSFTGATPVTGNATVYAMWVPYTRTVQFDSDEATVPASPASIAVVSPAASVGTLPSAPLKTGYLFGGWYTGSDGQGNPFNGASPVGGDMTVYAWWKAYTYTIRFDSRDATVAASPAVKTVASPATTLALMPADPVKTGYTLHGWFTGIDGAGTRYLATTPVTGDLTLYAYWLPDAGVSASVSFPSNGPVTIVNDNASVAKGTAYTVSIPEAGYSRYQWYVDGVLQASGTNALSVDTASLFAGVHTVMIYITDATGSGASASCRFTVKN